MKTWQKSRKSWEMMMIIIERERDIKKESIIRSIIMMIIITMRNHTILNIMKNTIHQNHIMRSIMNFIMKSHITIDLIMKNLILKNLTIQNHTILSLTMKNIMMIYHTTK